MPTSHSIRFIEPSALFAGLAKKPYGVSRLKPALRKDTLISVGIEVSEDGKASSYDADAEILFRGH